MALLVLGSFGTNAADAVPLVLKYQASTEEDVHSSAAIALVRIGAPAEKVVPLILSQIPQTNPPPALVGPFPGRGWIGWFGALNITPMMRDLWALGQYGREAQMALPILTNLQSCPVGNIQETAREAAKKIRDE
jgi:hypothetical protein